jgi:hypothetical protein
LTELAVRFVKFPIWKETGPLGVPVALVFVAERLVVDTGQNQLAFGAAQVGS